MSRARCGSSLGRPRPSKRDLGRVRATFRFRGANLGVIEAFDRTGGPEFRAEDEHMLLSAAASAATAVATAQSVEARQLAPDAESR